MSGSRPNCRSRASGSPPACTSRPRPRTWSAPCTPAGPRSAGRVQPAVDPGRHRRGAGRRLRRRASSPGTAPTRPPTVGTSTRRSPPRRTSSSTTAVTWSPRCTPTRGSAAGRAGRMRGDHDRRGPAPSHGRRGRAALPGRRGQRQPHQAPVRQPLRHRSVDCRRVAALDQHAARRRERRGGRLRALRPWRGRATGRARRARHRHRGRSRPCAGGDVGGLRGAADGPGRADRRRLRHGHRQQGRHRG